MYFRGFDPQFYERVSVRLSNHLRMKFQKRGRVIFLGAATYNNLGDVAISYAQSEFLEMQLNRRVVIVPDTMLNSFFGKYSRDFRDEDLFIFPGGGNFGSLYPVIEDERRRSISKIRQTLKHPKILIFPQSINICDEQSSEFSRFYRDVIVVAREKFSYECAKHVLVQSTVILSPDIVFSLDGVFGKNVPETINKIGLIARNDKEKLGSSIISDTHMLLKETGAALEQFDTVIDSPRMFSVSARKRAIQKITSKIMDTDLVITDRLHGMILALITHTPVIAYDNSTKKISGTISSWLLNNKNVYLVDDNNEVTYDSFVDWYHNLTDLNETQLVEYKYLITVLKELISES